MNKIEKDLEEIQIWKKNSTFMYNMLHFKTLDWPSLTCQWLPGKEERDGSEIYQLILGTHAEQEENMVIVAEVSITENNIERQSVNGEGDSVSQYARQAKVETKRKMIHSGDVNRARYMPQNESIIATRSSENDSFIYDKNGLILTLRGHSDEGYGLSWDRNNEGRLLTAGFDHQICLWDINQRESNSVITPTSVITGHSNKVEDIGWHPCNEGTFASVSDDKWLYVWDSRHPQAPSMRTMAHEDDANCLAWHPVTSHLLLTGGSDECVYLWDTRKLVNPVHTFEDDGAVYRVVWSPLQETMFVSSGLHRRIRVWDVSAIGDDVLSLVEEGGPPELSLVHSGHLESITDLDWHPHLQWTLASVSEDNALNLWQMNGNVFE